MVLVHIAIHVDKKFACLFFSHSFNLVYFYPKVLDFFSLTNHGLEPQLHRLENIQLKVLGEFVIYP
jgi:hypothetical protein